MSSDAGETSAVRTIGRYRAFDELGRGAMGVVYRGFDPVIGRTVALKTLLLDGAEGQAKEFRDRLYREAAAAGALSHPNIVTIFDIIEDGRTTAVAMEFIEGRSLATIISERAPLPFDLAVDIFDQIASALDYAGSHGIVHRDIKPANILITPLGRVKVTDFGVARLALSTMTQAGTVLGSPSYMSPEQVRGLPLDGRSDLFSAAVVFYEMITRERPFSGNDVATTMYRIAHEAPTPPSQFNAAVGPPVSTVLDRALAKNPADRYQTGAELAAELRSAASLLPSSPDVPARSAERPAAASVPASAVTPGQVAAPRAATRPQGGAAPLVLPALPDPAPADQSVGPRLAAIPTGAVPAVAMQSGNALAALPPGSAAVPAARAKPAGSSRRVAIAVGSAVALLLVAVVVVFVLRRGLPDGAAPADAAPPPAAVLVTPPAPTPAPAPPAPPVPLATPAGMPGPSTPQTAPRPTPPRTSPGTTAGGRAGARTETAATPVSPVVTRRDEGVRPAPAARSKVYAVTDVDERPQVLKQVPPAYPDEAMKSRIEDVVVLKVLVDASGRSEEVQVLRALAKSPSLNGAAVAAVRQYQFSPARKGGQPVPCWFNVGVPFQLPRQ